MARPRRDQDYTALYVRIPSAEAEKLHRAADVLGRPKRELITRLVAEFDPADPVWTREVAGPQVAAQAEFGFGQHSFRPAGELEILTPAQLAGLLQVEEEVVVELAESGELPARRVGEEWRFSREAILAWLAADE
ncbi:MAG TPA: helix-turn-helix domain-containing protein [Gaiellaceae bacterium]|nr:helix-turn-helix domain-containing protein [Gaiellaceae bacterium]